MDKTQEFKKIMEELGKLKFNEMKKQVMN